VSIFEFLGGLGWTSHSDKYLQKRQRVFHRNLIYGETGHQYLSPTHPSITTIMHSHLHDLPIKRSQLNMRGPSHRCRASALATSMHPTPTATNFPTRKSENTPDLLYTSATTYNRHNHRSSKREPRRWLFAKSQGVLEHGPSVRRELLHEASDPHASRSHSPGSRNHQNRQESAHYHAEGDLVGGRA